MNALVNLPQNANLPSHFSRRDTFDLSSARSHTVLGYTEPSYNPSHRVSRPPSMVPNAFSVYSLHKSNRRMQQANPMRPCKSSPSLESFPSDTGRSFELLSSEVRADHERDRRFGGQCSRFSDSGRVALVIHMGPPTTSPDGWHLGLVLFLPRSKCGSGRGSKGRDRCRDSKSGSARRSVHAV